MRSKHYLASVPLTLHSNVRLCSEVFDNLNEYLYVRNPASLIIQSFMVVKVFLCIYPNLSEFCTNHFHHMHWYIVCLSNKIHVTVVTFSNFPRMSHGIESTKY
jgi:hypothetical protein